jgi:putative hemolysin
MTNTIISLILYRFIILIILMLLTIFFTASETALTVLRRSQINRLIEQKGVKALKAWLNDPNRLLTTTLIGTAVSVVGISVIGTTIALDISLKFGVPPLIATTVNTILVIIAVLVFAEIVPKAFARRNAEKVSCMVIKPLKVVDFILAPFVRIFTLMSDIVIRILGGKTLKEQPLFDFEEIKGLIEMGVKEGVIAKSEKKMLSQILEFEDTVVREVMVPRGDMKTLDLSDPSDDLLDKAIKFRHSRIPVYRDNIDNIAGLLYVKDLLPILLKEEEVNIGDILRKPYFVPETKPVNSLLKEFRQGREHMAIVVDEYGDTTGLVTIEDIVEEITGEIFDEYDIKKNTIVSVGDRRWEIDASEDLDKINDKLNADLPEDEYDSLAGLIVGELGRLPKSGEMFDYGKYRFEIIKADPNRIIKVKLQMPD